MGIGRILIILCGMILAVCLVFSISALTVLRNAVAETDRVRKDAQEMMERLEEYSRENHAPDALPVQGQVEESLTEEPDKETAACEPEGYYLRECRGKIGIFTAEGDLIRIEETAVDALPAKDREALAEGIYAKNWKDVLEHLQDLGS